MSLWQGCPVFQIRFAAVEIDDRDNHDGLVSDNQGDLERRVSDWRTTITLIDRETIL